jgi:hypothetical protein
MANVDSMLRRGFAGDARVVGFVLALAVFASACGGGSSTARTSSSPEASRGSGPAGSTAKATVPIDKRIELRDATARVGEPLRFRAAFSPHQPGSYSFASAHSGPVALVIPADVDLRNGTTSVIDGSVTATAAGSGTATLTATIVSAGTTQATTITVFVAAADGWTAAGTSSSSATELLLLRTLHDRGVLDDAEFTRRRASLGRG